jgi:hypothetical protein
MRLQQAKQCSSSYGTAVIRKCRIEYKIKSPEQLLIEKKDQLIRSRKELMMLSTFGAQNSV